MIISPTGKGISESYSLEKMIYFFSEIPQSLDILDNDQTMPLVVHYQIILRADADTFFLPSMRDYWPGFVEFHSGGE